MARTPIAAAQIMTLADSQPLTVVADAADLAWTDSDQANGLEVEASGKDLILAFNDEVGAQTITITTADDEIGRSGSVDVYSIGAGEMSVFGMFPTKHWRQADGMIYIDTSDDGVQVIIIRTP